MANSLKTASILLAPLGKAIVFVDAVALSPDKWKYIMLEGFKNMLTLILCVAVWIITCFLQSVHAFLPSSVSTKALAGIIAKTTDKAEEEALASQSSNPLAGSAIGRALSQVLALMNETPVSSRKYEFVRDLAEKMIDENTKNGSPAVREVNRMALSAGFRRTLRLLSSALRGLRGDSLGRLTWKLLRRIPLYGQVAPHVSRALGYLKTNIPRLHPSDAGVNASSALETAATMAESVLAEKLAAELLWVAEKLAECGDMEEALLQWSEAEAASLASLSVSAHPRVQGSLLRVSVFLLKELARGDVEEAKVKMLLQWLPLFSYATNGVESLVLTSAEKADVERLLEETIEGLGEKDKEMVLSSWLHHYMHSAHSDWPNLGKCYRRWCSLSRSTLS